MKTRNKRILLVLFVAFVGILTYPIYIVEKFFHRIETLACLSVAARYVGDAQEQNRFELNDESRELTQDEIKQLFVGRKVGECQSEWFNAGEIHIAIGNVNRVAKQVKVKAWTNGDDGIQGTSDDLVIPFEEEEP